MQHVYSRSPTASQPLLWQRHILTEAGLLVRAEDVTGGFLPAVGVRLYGDPATTSKVPSPQRPAFSRIAAAAEGRYRGRPPCPVRSPRRGGPGGVPAPGHVDRRPLPQAQGQPRRRAHRPGRPAARHPARIRRTTT